MPQLKHTWWHTAQQPLISEVLQLRTMVTCQALRSCIHPPQFSTSFNAATCCQLQNHITCKMLVCRQHGLRHGGGREAGNAG